MRRPALILFILLLCRPVFSQTPDIELLFGRDWSSFRIEETLPDSLTKLERAAALVGRQLTGECYFDPPCYEFPRLAWDEFGPASIFFTADRLTRCSRIGTARESFRMAGDGHIHEGVGVYSWKKPATGNVVTFNPRPMEAITASPEGARKWSGDDLEFVDYLIENGLQKDAALLAGSGNYFESDTLHYMKGWTCYNIKELEAASAEFDLVPESSIFYDKSLFYNVVCSVHSGDTGRGLRLLDSYKGGYREVENLQRAGIALLDNDMEAYRKASANFSYNSAALVESEEQLKSIYESISSASRKSPALAAAASAVIPGLGKIYAGQIGEGISSLMAVGALGAITAENWAKHGPGNWKTILFGTLGAVFYIGNIYGSYVSVSVQNNGIKEINDSAILYHIHIPLRAVFN